MKELSVSKLQNFTFSLHLYEFSISLVLYTVNLGKTIIILTAEISGTHLRISRKGRNALKVLCLVSRKFLKTKPQWPKLNGGK